MGSKRRQGSQRSLWGDITDASYDELSWKSFSSSTLLCLGDNSISSPSVSDCHCEYLCKSVAVVISWLAKWNSFHKTPAATPASPAPEEILYLAPNSYHWRRMTAVTFSTITHRQPTCKFISVACHPLSVCISECGDMIITRAGR